MGRPGPRGRAGHVMRDHRDTLATARRARPPACDLAGHALRAGPVRDGRLLVDRDHHPRLEPARPGAACAGHFEQVHPHRRHPRHRTASQPPRLPRRLPSAAAWSPARITRSGRAARTPQSRAPTTTPIRAGARSRSSPARTLPTRHPSGPGRSKAGAPGGSRSCLWDGSTRAGPIRTNRGKHATRHVPGGAPGGGYDLSAASPTAAPEASGGQLGLF
jgi:hypothetical protein